MNDSKKDQVLQDFDLSKESFFDFADLDESPETDSHDFQFHDLATDDDGFEEIFESKERKKHNIEKKKRKSNKKSAAKAVKSLASKEDDLVFLDEPFSGKKHSEINEIDLEELIQLELDSDYHPQTNPVTPKETESKSQFSISWFTIFYLMAVVFFLYIAFHFQRTFRSAIEEYENNQPEIYMESLIADFQDPEVEKSLFHFPEISYTIFDSKEKLANDYFAYLESASLTFERADSYRNEQPVFSFFANGIYKGDIYLNAVKDRVLLNQFPIYSYTCDHVDAYVEVVSQSYTITTPNCYHVYVNNMLLSDAFLTDQAEEIEELSPYKDYTDVPYYVTYELKDLIFEPDIHIYSAGGQEISYLCSGTVYTANASFDQMDFPASLMISTNILEVMETYSNFLSGDLSGKDHGFSQISDAFLKDTAFYQSTKDLLNSDYFSTIAEHTLPEYVFTSRSITDYTLYTQDLFSCVVTLEKNLVLSDGTAKTFLEEYFCFYAASSDEVSEDGLTTYKIMDIQKLQ